MSKKAYDTISLIKGNTVIELKKHANDAPTYIAVNMIGVLHPINDVGLDLFVSGGRIDMVFDSKASRSTFTETLLPLIK